MYYQNSFKESPCFESKKIKPEILRNSSWRENVQQVLVTSLQSQTMNERALEVQERCACVPLTTPRHLTIFRLRTGHNRLKYHIHKIFKVGETDLCSCGQAAEMAQHVLQDCRPYSNVRQSIWRERVDMHTKLYRPLPELEKTVAFIAQAGIGI